jgi:ubiquinone/menaquinone biosynthesis C-methylase UbiE
MAGRAGHEAAAVVNAYDFAGLRRLVDVGAGSGLLTRAALERVPTLTATLVDRPAAVSLAREQLTAAGLADRCTFVAADFFEAVPAGGDGYLLSRVLHDWDDTDAARILRVCRAAMPPSGRLIVVDAVLPARARDLPAAIRMDLHMLVLFGAAERTEQEMRQLLDGAGFEVRRIVPTDSPTGLAVIEAHPRPDQPGDTARP